MALGMPGSAGMAILIGAYLMMGLIAGPEMMTKRLDLSLLLLLTVAIASIVAAVICFLLSPYMAAIAKVPSRIMVPIIGILIIFSAYTPDERIMNVFKLLVFGGVGLFASIFNYVRPSIMLGYILGGLFEKFAFLSYYRYGVFFFMRPVSLVILAVMVAYFNVPHMR
jgi:TctA family transporter